MTARFGEFVLDCDQRRLSRNGLEVHVTPKAFDLLMCLIDEAPRVVRKEELHERLWPGIFVSDATLVGMIKELRRALDDRNSSAPVIRTAHRVGYAFAAPLEKDEPRRLTVSRWIVVGSRRVPLTKGENVIGRDPASGILLDATGVSRRHARILIEGGDAWVEDLGSKNGTMVRQEELTGRARLHDGDEIRLGPVAILYRSSARGVSTDTADRGSPRRGRRKSES